MRPSSKSTKNSSFDFEEFSIQVEFDFVLVGLTALAENSTVAHPSELPPSPHQWE